MNIKAEFEGEELEFEVLGSHYGQKDGTTHYFGYNGVILLARAPWSSDVMRLRLIRKRHTFGGGVFEETGEERKPEKDEFYLGPIVDGKGVCTQHGPSKNHGATYPILLLVGREVDGHRN